MDNRHIIALEIGTSTLKLGLAGISESGTVILESVETRPLHGGVRYGRIQNIDEVSDALADAVSAMSRRPGFAPARITGAYVGIGGRSLGTVSSRVSLALPEDGPISRQVIERLENEAAGAVPEGRQMLRIIPLRYTVDDLPTQNPVGTIGSRIAAEYTLVHCDPRNMRNIETVVCQRLGLDICGWAVRPLAIADLCLLPEETKPGCMLADIGAETTTVTIFKDCKLRYIATIPLGSRHITGDLSQGLGITEEEAESLKRRLGSAVSDSSSMTVEQINIDKFIQARASEIAANIVAYIDFAGFKNTDLAGGIVITGRGSKLKNFAALLENSSRMRVRKATPRVPFEIADTSIVESDMTDLLALSAYAVRYARSPEAVPCIDAPAPEPPTAPGPGEKPEPRRETDDRETPGHEDSAFTIDEGPARTYAGFGDDSDDFNSYERRGTASAGTARDDYDDPYLLSDDNEAEKLRQRDEEAKAEKRRQAERRRKKEEDRARAAEQKQRQKELKREKPNPWITRLQTLKGSLSNLVSGPDDTDDLDEL